MGVANSASSAPNLSPATPIGRRVLLERAPEQIELTLDDFVDILRDGVRNALRFFWVALALGAVSHRGIVTIVVWAALILLPIVFQLLPSRREKLKRQLRVERQLDRLPRYERRRIRRLVREWMRGVDREED